MPDDENSKADGEQFLLIPSISDTVPDDIPTPERFVRAWKPRKLAPSMDVPEAPMHKYHSLVSGKHDVGPSRQCLSMKAKSVTESV